MQRLLPPVLVALLLVVMDAGQDQGSGRQKTAEGGLLDIGEVIAASGVPASTLHVWERAGLIRSVKRNGLRRQFDADVVDRIALIVLGKRTGFSLKEIEDLLAPDAFADGKELLESKLAELRQRRAEIDAAIEVLDHAIACPAPSPIECPGFRATLPDVLPVP